MKKLILLLTVFFTCLGVKAQVATTDYIYSSDGFVVKTSVFTASDNNYTYKCTGLYSKDGKVLVSAISADYYSSYDYRFYVLDGCETIASGAFQGVYDCRVYIPSSVTNIAPDAIVSKVLCHGGSQTYKFYNRFGGIQDGVREENGSGAINAPAADPNATEVARYNVQGVRLSEPTNGVNIVQMSDGIAEKVLVR